MKGLRSLNNLNLAHCDQLTEEGLKVLSELKSIEYLDLRETPVTDAALQELSTLKSLKRIMLMDCTRVTDAGVAEFQRSLPLCEITR